MVLCCVRTSGIIMNIRETALMIKCLDLCITQFELQLDNAEEDQVKESVRKTLEELYNLRFKLIFTP